MLATAFSTAPTGPDTITNAVVVAVVVPFQPCRQCPWQNVPFESESPCGASLQWWDRTFRKTCPSRMNSSSSTCRRLDTPRRQSCAIQWPGPSCACRCTVSGATPGTCQELQCAWVVVGDQTIAQCTSIGYYSFHSLSIYQIALVLNVCVMPVLGARCVVRMMTRSAKFQNIGMHSIHPPVLKCIKMKNSTTGCTQLHTPKLHF
jgi:hypothetical protein